MWIGNRARRPPVRFVPYPVIGGFLGAAGWLVVVGAVQIVTGYRPRLAGLGNFLDALILAKLAAVAGVAAARLPARRRCNGPLALPALWLACAAAVYAVLALFGVSLSQAQADGWMFQTPAPAALSPPWDLK